MKHVIIKDCDLNGWEYGMLRSFERSVMDVTGAETILIPEYSISKKYMSHFGPSMNKSFMRNVLPKDKFNIEGDVGWYILMGPENYKLDLFYGWSENIKTKILYLFDTLPEQFGTIKKLFSNTVWDICITSFNDAVDDLQRLTGRKWFYVPQAADDSLFKVPGIGDKTIHFSSYGRRLPVMHDALIEFCQSNGLYYDYTTHDGKHPTSDSVELYKQYAWHLNHTLFNISWPVEVTNPKRAGHLNPITCRWYEAAMSGCVLIGKKPNNVEFDIELASSIIENIDPFQGKKQIFSQLDALQKNSIPLYEKSKQIRLINQPRWNWKCRVNSILNLLEL